MRSLWDDAAAAQQPELGGLLYASRLAGADPALVLWGGGNTSAKLTETDFRGRRVPVLRIKGSGSDLRTIRREQFPGVRLDDVLPLRERESMGDEEMVVYVRHALLEPDSPRPSVETLLHAFLPARFIVHTHADAILALTNTPHGRRWIGEALRTPAGAAGRGRADAAGGGRADAAGGGRAGATLQGPSGVVRQGQGPPVWIDYHRPGFTLSRQVYQGFIAQPDASCVVLENHGLVTWGDTAREAYERTVELVTRAEAFLRKPSPPGPAAHVGIPSPPGPLSHQGRGRGLDTAARRRVYAAVAPLIRGLAARTRSDGEVLAPAQTLEVPAGGRLVLRFEDGDEVLSFASDPAVARLSQVGPATPDHLIYTRRTALYVPVQGTAHPHPNPLPGGEASLPLPRGDAARSAGDGSPEQHLIAAITTSLEPAWRAWVQEYVRYLRTGATKEGRDVSDADVRPRVVLLPGVGMVTLGQDARAALVAADIYRHGTATIRGAEAVERYSSLDVQQCFDVEYWPLERYRLSLQPPEAELSRRVALVTGAASGIGRAIAERFCAEGAHVVVSDLNAGGAAEVAAALASRYGDGRAVGIGTEVADEASVAAAFRAAVEAFGGLDVLVSNAGIAPFSALDDLPLADWQRSLDVNATGHFLATREALRLFRRQGIGGNVVMITTKNVMAPGKEFGAYSAAKAAQAQLARVAALEGGELGVRVNMINPDAVFRGSTLWSPELRRARAAAHGVREDDLGDFYRSRCLLGLPIYPEDVAEAAFWLASDRSRKTDGTVITVDGGVPAAFPR